jgi:ATP-dependent RNA helicase SUPV3L1/SUV3
MEVLYTFTWAPKPRHQRPERNAERGPRPERKEGDRPRGDRPKREGQGDRPQGDRPKGERRDHGKGGKPPRDDRQKSFEARPPRAEKPIDPDNPFAALLALKGKV